MSRDVSIDVKLLGLSIATVASLSALAAVAKEQESRLNRASGTSAELRLEGVCDLAAPRVDCWMPDGTPNPDLRALMAANLLLNPKRKPHSTPDHRSRTLVLRYAVRGLGGFGSTAILADPSGKRLNPSQYLGTPTDGALVLYDIQVGVDQHKFDLAGGLDVEIPPEWLELRAGASATLAVGSVRVDSIRKNDLPPRGHDRGHSEWLIALSVNGNVPGMTLGIEASPRDAVNDEIGWVPGNTNPWLLPAVPPTRQERSITPSMERRADAWCLRIDPSKVDHLLIGPMLTANRLFLGVALEKK